jgi:hypothetical protein
MTKRLAITATPDPQQKSEFQPPIAPMLIFPNRFNATHLTETTYQFKQPFETPPPDVQFSQISILRISVKLLIIFSKTNFSKVLSLSPCDINVVDTGTGGKDKILQTAFEFARVYIKEDIR